MKAKKNKALAEELIEDLLEEDHQEDSQAEPPKLDLSDEPTRVSSKSSSSSPTEEDESSFHVAEVSNIFQGKDDDEVTTPVPLDLDSDSGAEIVDYFTQESQQEGSRTIPTADDATYKLPEEKISNPFSSSKKNPFASHDKTRVVGQDTAKVDSKNHYQAEDKVRSSVGRFAGGLGTGLHSPAGAALAQSENLRIAQTRILELEQEVERIRQENEQLAAAGETLRKRADEHASKLENALSKAERDRENYQQEKELLTESLEAKTKEMEELNLKIDELEMRLSTNIQKIRVRERELENRLELVKMESQALVRNKDEIILDLKRQLDQVNLELDNYRNKGHELNKQLADKQDMLRRTVKALRIALSMLEGDEEIVKPLKKVK